MATPLLARSKSALVKALESVKSRQVAEGRRQEVASAKLMESVGSATAFATAATVGYMEGRITNNDGTPLSLGPIPLPLFAATVATGVAWFYNPGGQVSAAAHGASGLYGGTMARRWGTAARTKKSIPAPSKVSGEDVGWAPAVEGPGDLTAAERELIYG